MGSIEDILAVRDELAQPAFWCNKCNYVGTKESHPGCDYFAGPIRSPAREAMATRLEKALIDLRWRGIVWLVTEGSEARAAVDARIASFPGGSTPPTPDAAETGLDASSTDAPPAGPTSAPGTPPADGPEHSRGGIR